MIKKFWIFLVIIFFLSCKEEKSTNRNNPSLNLPKTDITHLPNNIHYEVKNKIVNELILNKLENGVDSFELRLWTKIEVSNGGNILVIKKINDAWTCLEYSYLETRKDYKGEQNVIGYVTSFTIDTFWVKKLQPLSDWENFLTEINKENIYELPTQSDIIGWKDIVTDGYTYNIEFATKNNYRFYTYNCPDIYEDDFKECQHMTNILAVFNKEFGLKMGSSYRCEN